VCIMVVVFRHVARKSGAACSASAARARSQACVGASESAEAEDSAAAVLRSLRLPARQQDPVRRANYLVLIHDGMKFDGFHGPASAFILADATFMAMRSSHGIDVPPPV